MSEKFILWKQRYARGEWQFAVEWENSRLVCKDWDHIKVALVRPSGKRFHVKVNHIESMATQDKVWEVVCAFNGQPMKPVE